MKGFGGDTRQVERVEPYKNYLAVEWHTFLLFALLDPHYTTTEPNTIYLFPRGYSKACHSDSIQGMSLKGPQ